MADDFRITNCHVHCFTLDHVPDGFVSLFGLPMLGLVRQDWIRVPLMWVLRRALPFERRDKLERAARFAEISAHHRGQTGVLNAVRRYYPEGTRFVVLPMDLAHMGAGTPRKDLRDQHDELARIAASDRFRGTVLPFAHVHPDRPEAVEELKRCVETHGFHGVKLYPPLGFPPDHPRLMEEVYPYCVEKGLPVISHCSRGGVRHKDMPEHRTRRFAHPHAFRPVLDAFPELRVCLAHFGGTDDWRDYLEKGMEPGDAKAREANYLTALLDMMKSGDYPNLYTDISYTIFYFDDHFPALRVFLEDAHVRARVLFGSDFYMAEMERFPERSLSIRLRYALGGALYRQLAQTNAERWLTGHGPGGAAPVDDAPTIG